MVNFKCLVGWCGAILRECLRCSSLFTQLHVQLYDFYVKDEVCFFPTNYAYVSMNYERTTILMLTSKAFNFPWVLYSHRCYPYVPIDTIHMYHGHPSMQFTSTFIFFTFCNLNPLLVWDHVGVISITWKFHKIIISIKMVMEIYFWVMLK